MGCWSGHSPTGACAGASLQRFAGPGAILLHSRLKVAESASEVGGLTFGPTKNYETRTIVIHDLLREELARHMAETGPGREDLVFTAPKGGPLRGTNFNHRIWTPELTASAGLPEELHGLRMHSLRRTCAALLIADGPIPRPYSATSATAASS